MDAGLRTPLLDLFRRGEVARDVRLLAARGEIAPRPHEQLGLLALLTADADAEVRDTAEATLSRIPSAVIAGFIARPDAPGELRTFFQGRGIEPQPTDEPDELHCIDAADEPAGVGSANVPIAQRVSTMTVPEKVRAAMKGSREMRAVLVRDPNKIVAMAVLSSPRMTESEVESIARMGSVSDEVLRTIGQTRAWTKNYGILAALVRNPKTPLAVSLTLLPRINDRDLKYVSIDRNVPDPLRIAARKRVILGEKR